MPKDSDQSNNELCTPPRKRARMEQEISPNDEGYVSRSSIEETPKEMKEEI